MQAEFLNGTKSSICSHAEATYACVIALTSTILAKPVCQCQSTSTHSQLVNELSKVNVPCQQHIDATIVSVCPLNLGST